MSIKIKFQKIKENVIIPHYEHPGDSGMDIYSCEDNLLLPGERKLISTGLKVEIPEGYEMQIRSKSGLAINSGISTLNSPGTVDSGYRGEICVILINHSKEDFQVKKGQKIAQAVISKVEQADIETSEELSETSRGEGGFGSTGLTNS